MPSTESPTRWPQRWTAKGASLPAQRSPCLYNALPLPFSSAARSPCAPFGQARTCGPLPRKATHSVDNLCYDKLGAYCAQYQRVMILSMGSNVLISGRNARLVVCYARYLGNVFGGGTFPVFPLFLSRGGLQSPTSRSQCSTVRLNVHTRPRSYLCPMRNTLHPMHRKTKRTHTRAQLAALLGCSVWTVDRLRRSFLTDRQRAYLNAAGYCAAFHPKRKGQG